MKHIFTIHSHLTFLMSYCIIQHHRLNKDDVILLASKYKVSIGDFKVCKSYQDEFQGFLKKTLHWNVPESHDKYIDKLTGGSEFVAYIDLMSYYQKILVTHRHCRAFHFMEEGNGAYMEQDDLTDITWPERQHSYRSKFGSQSFRKAFMRVLRGYNLRLLSIPYNYMSFANFDDLKFYCFSANAFYNAPVAKKVQLVPEKSDPNINIMALNVSLDNEIVWIDGSNGRYTGLDESYYHEAVEKAILTLQSRYPDRNTIYVKLRPKEAVNGNFLINALRNSGFKVEVLPDYLVLEAFFANSSNCIVIGTLTAALEYAYCFGHKAYSIYPLFSKKPVTFFDRMKGYWLNVLPLS